jgi:alpha-L-fucosidase
MQYEPTLESVSKHTLPAWYDDAKFGIFIHWTPSCIPAFAPVHEDIASLIATEGEAGLFANSPYAEWYLNSLQIPGSPAAKHHAETWGANYSYDNFVARFNETIMDWEPSVWGDLFERACARYVVLVTKHHDGFTLFQSPTRNPHKPQWRASRDIVAELSEEVRARNLRMGLYYSGLIDWSFYHAPITDFLSLMASGSPDQAYANYVEAHYRELIDRFQPDILWNDIGYPARSDVFALFADYYNDIPDGAVNDRWLQTPNWLRAMITWSVTRPLARKLLSRGNRGGGIEPPRPPHSDYATPEYTVKKDISARKWECVRGIGKSFGYNAEERPEDYLGEAELIHLFVDIVSKNGNLLLNIGPKPDGTVPAIQVERLEA